MKKIKLGIIGYGNVGGSFAHFFKHRKKTIHVLTSKPIKSGKFIKFYSYEEIDDFLKKINVVLICVRDDKIQELVKILETKNLEEKVVYHTSGTFTSSILKPLKNAYIGSLHPIQTFPKPNYKLLKNIYFSFEGQKIRIAQRLVKYFNGKIFKVSEDKKTLYHIACIFASNFSALMWVIADNLIRESLKNGKLEVLIPLIQTTLKNAIIYGPMNALTGPAKRKDQKIITTHLEFLKNYNENIYKIYELISYVIFKKF